MLNSGLVLCHLIVIPIGVLTKQGGLITGTFAAVIVLLMKSPLIIFWTFRVNATNARIDQGQLREQRRQLDMEEALKKREERRKKSSKNILHTFI